MELNKFEMQIVRMLTNGYSKVVIGEVLKISTCEVEMYFKSIRDKINPKDIEYVEIYSTLQNILELT